MRVSLNWLRELLPDLTADSDELEGVFASLGMQAESVEKLSVPFTGVVVGRVEEVRGHPNADRLRLCRVTSDGQTEEVVCGAWNFESGAVVPWALPGSVLADGSEVGAVAIRGVQSHGMICSENELGLGDEEEGILVLDGDFAVGSDFGASLPFPDVVFDLEIESNRPDEQSMLGVAREVGAYSELDLVVPRVELDPEVTAEAADVSIEDPDGCGRFVAIPLAGVEVAPAPLWMRLRLLAAGMRPINNVVDVTNYVMLELGQPLHAFDLDRIVDESLTVRRAEMGEQLITLDGIERTLSPEDLIIADGEGVTSIAGVMGGERSEVQDDTTRVLLEAAHWHPPTIMRMSIRHSLRTEASARFSGGVDPNLPPVAARRAAEILANAGMSQVPEAMLDLVTRPMDPWTVELPLSDIPRLLGSEIDRDTTVRILERLHMVVDGNDPLSVTVPTWRPDLTRSADLVEEVARHYGYNKFPETLPRGSGSGLTPAQVRVRRIRSVLEGAGFSEAQTFSFMNPGDLDRLGLEEGHPARDVVEIRNPVSETEGVLRSTILPGLLRSAARNIALGRRDVALFEVGRVFTAEPSEGDERIPTQPVMLAFVALGEMGAFGLG
ncbi:MAG: phenylalanine--tRNA ligase subunit beta, partial [Acidimicrobiia bacterium]